MDLLKNGNSPHIRHEDSNRSIMLDVCVALGPALIWGIYVFGLRALVITLLSILSCVGAEALFQLLLRRKVTVGDLSAVVSGMLLAMNLPVAVPLWIIPPAAIFAMVVVKGLFGGLGKNPLNPILGAKAVLLLIFPSVMNRFTHPFSSLSPFRITLTEKELAGAVTVSPLRSLKEGFFSEITLSDLLTGSVAGNIGEVSSLLLLAGFLYLLVRRAITWHIPVCFFGTVTLMTLLFPQAGEPLSYMQTSLLSGGLLLGAVFMATDPSSSPVTTWGKVIFGILCGILTVVFRSIGTDTQGVVFAILASNLLARPLDILLRPRPYGEKSRAEKLLQKIREKKQTQK